MAQKFLSGIDISGNIVVDSNSAVGTTVLDIQGTQGQLFSLTNSLSGDLFSVSDISGIPILNVNSSGLINIDGKLGINNDSPAFGLDIDLDSVNDRINITAGGAQKAIINGYGNIIAYGSLTSYGNSLGGGGGIFTYKGGTATQTIGHRFQHVSGNFTGSSGDQTMMQINPTINQTSSAGYTGIKLNVTETATGSGTKNLLDLQVGGTSKTTISNAGNATFSGTVTGTTFNAINNESYYAKDSSGNNRRLIRYGTDNNTYIGAGIGELYFQTSGGQKQVFHEGHLPTLTELGAQAAGSYLTSDVNYLKSNADDTASGIITLTKNTATGLANSTFSHAKTIIGGLHFANGNGSGANQGKQAAITFQGSSASEAQAGIYVHNNNSEGTHMLFATTDSYNTGPKAGITLFNTGNVTIRGTVTANGTVLTGDQTLPTASSLGAVTLTGTQTISGVKTFTNGGNYHNGHLYYTSYDAAGNHYPHFLDGSSNSGTTINWRQYYGSSLKTHTWTSDSSGNMVFTYQGAIKAVGELEATSLDINGNADISGTLNVSSNLSTNHIHAASDSSYNVGTNSVRYANGYFDTVHGSVAYANITSKPTNFPTNFQASATGDVGHSGLQNWNLQESTLDLNPTTDWHTSIRIGHGDPVDYYSNTLAIQMTGGDSARIRTRTNSNGTYGSWKKYWHDGDFSTAQVLNSNVTSVSGNAGSVTNGVYTTGNQTIDGVKQFNNYINAQSNIHMVGHLYNGDANTSIDLKDHSSYTWFRNAQNRWVFQGGTGGDDWTQSFHFNLETVGSGYNDKVMLIGQQQNNSSSGGKYKGVRIVKSTGSSTVVDGYLQAGDAVFSGDISATRIVTSGLYGTGHGSSILPIWQYNAGNPGYGIGYTEGSPDDLRIDVSGNLMSGTPDFQVLPNEAKVNGNAVYHGGNKPTLLELGFTGDADATNDQDLSSLAPKASPTFTGVPAAPTAAAATNTTQIATTAFVSTAVSNLVDGSPALLNTLDELASAIGDDENFSTTITNSIGTKLPLAGGTITGNLNVNGNTVLGNALTDKAVIHGHLGIGDDSYPKIAYPGQNALWGGSGSTTGQIVIDLPGTLSNYDMMYMEIDIYEYSSKGATKLIIGGHNWNSGANSNTSATQWHNVNVQVIGALDKPVYFGRRNDGTSERRCIAIGETNSAWSYATVQVHKVHGAEFYGTGIDWVGDWNINQTTSGTYFTKNPTTNFNSGTTLETNGNISAANLSGTNTGDQDLSSFLTASSTDLDSRYFTETESDARFLKYKGVVSGDWDTIFTTGTGNTNTSGLFQIQNHAATGNSNTPTGSYTYGSVLAWQLPNATFKLYAPHTGSLHYQTGWSNDEYSGWRKMWDSGNDGAGSGLDADLLDGLQASAFALVNANTTGSSGSCTGNAATATTAANAQLLDNIDSSSFLRSDAQDAYTPKRIDFSASSGWDAVGFGNLTNMHFQGHNQFWVGAGNGTWFSGTANTKSSTSGLAADASAAHDLLITTMQGSASYDRGITFSVDTGGSGTSGYRLGKWHSSNEQHSSKLTVDGGLHVRGGDMLNFDYYADDYSTYWDNQAGGAYWTGDTGWIDPSITAGNAIQIQAGNTTTNANNPALQFHQYGYGGVQFRYDGPNNVMHLESTAAGRMTYFQLKTDHGYLQMGAMNTSHCHLYTDRASFYTNKPILVNGTTLTGLQTTVSGSSGSCTGNAATATTASAVPWAGITSRPYIETNGTTSATATTAIASVAHATYTAAFFDFVIKNGTNVRAGTVAACHDGTNVEFTETSTVDLGDTSDVTLNVVISTSYLQLQATTTSSTWTIKSLIRAI